MIGHVSIKPAALVLILKIRNRKNWGEEEDKVNDINIMKTVAYMFSEWNKLA